MAVKNSARPAGPNGEKTIWAYYIFTDDRPIRRSQLPRRRRKPTRRASPITSRTG
jgi:hypothetical protein